MADLEIVIKGLECCLKDATEGCPDCPYVGNDDEHSWKCRELREDALALLKKQDRMLNIALEYVVDVVADGAADLVCSALTDVDDVCAESCQSYDGPRVECWKRYLEYQVKEG